MGASLISPTAATTAASGITNLNQAETNEQLRKTT